MNYLSDLIKYFLITLTTNKNFLETIFLTKFFQSFLLSAILFVYCLTYLLGLRYLQQYFNWTLQKKYIMLTSLRFYYDDIKDWQVFAFNLFDKNDNLQVHKTLKTTLLVNIQIVWIFHVKLWKLRKLSKTDI